jgi:2-keto-3-deoxy-galactonokinase
MRGEEVGPFISGLLIAHEIGSATGTLVGKAKVTVIADGELAQNYSEALGCFDFSANILSPRHCFVRGMLRLAADG